MIAYHFPPLAGSSGIQRTLRFAQHLPSLGWEPIVVTTTPMAYERTSDDLLAEVPAEVKVERLPALDTRRHLSAAGRYLAWMARPDRWVSWVVSARLLGGRILARHRPDVIWSTYPIPSAHLIGRHFSRRAGVPWVADFRDPMAQDGYPSDPELWQAFARIEAQTIQHAAFSVFTAESAARTYRERYPGYASRIITIENGFDEASFEGVAPRRAAEDAGRLLMLHSGIVYPSDRDPRNLLDAIRTLRREGLITPSNFVIRFRASASDGLLDRLARERAVRDMIDLAPRTAYREALAEMLGADSLLVLQGATCNAQVPAKVYEYLRAARPILGLADPSGDTARVLLAAGIEDVAALEDLGAVTRALRDHVTAIRSSRARTPDPTYAARCERRHRSTELGQLFERAVQGEARSQRVSLSYRA
jgi:hypothetical protein